MAQVYHGIEKGYLAVPEEHLEDVQWAHRRATGTLKVAQGVAKDSVIELRYRYFDNRTAASLCV